ncbi:uncharacterized protein LOC141836046 [Curcuma longa]|uniref:uncharacterized protein LOC141836046 n=1 Tax=Curcuma longa TaxID=136217 RepID=UPI003D9F2CEF
MRRADPVEFPFDPEIERTYRRRLHAQRVNNQEESSNNMAQKSLKDYAAPQMRGMTSCIALPNIEVANFEFNPGFIAMIQQNQFGGGPHEDPNLHLEIFSDACSTRRTQGFSFDVQRLILFRFSLRDKAKDWYHSLPPNCIHSWEQCEKLFLNKFYPPSKTAHMRNLISSFTQMDGETLYEAWDRFQGMLRKCPHHGLERWLIIHTFYNGINYQTKVYLDSAAGGALMNKSLEEAEELIENVALNHHQWANERGSMQRTPGRYSVDNYTKLNAQIDALSKRVENMSLGKVNAVVTTCEICGDSSHTTEIWHIQSKKQPVLKYLQSGLEESPKFFIPQQQQQGPSYQSAQKPNEEVSDTQKILKILEQLQGDVVKINEKLDDHDKRMKMQETQIAQISSSLSSRTVGALPGKPDFNPMEHCKAIELRSGRTLKDREPQVTAPREGISFTPAAVQPPSSVPDVEDTMEEVETASPAGIQQKKSYVRNIPYPQRLLYKQKDEEFEKLYNRVKDLTLEVPLLDALIEMPKFAKFIKGLMSTKDITRPKKVVALTEDISEKILNNKIPQKLKDPGSFFLPCKIGNISIGRAFCDLGASVSIIPYVTSERCGFTDLKLTPMAIQLADQTCRYPKGIVEDVPVEVGGFTIPTDFVVLDMEEDPSIPIILGRSFLATSGAKIDVKNRKL